MARAAQMADIDQYLSDSTPTEQTGLPPLDTSAPTEAIGASEIEESSGGQGVAKPAVVPEDEEEERASIRAMRQAQTEAARQREEESEVARATRQVAQSLQDSGTSIGQAIRGTARSVGGAIAGFPIPGDLLLPLSILLLFFFALIAVNGHTRLMWLWLTLTGNASITTGGGASFAPVTGTPVGTPLSTPGLPPLPRSASPLSGTLTPLVPLAAAAAPMVAAGTFAEEIL
jgi:hypothetical protein